MSSPADATVPHLVLSAERMYDKFLGSIPKIDASPYGGFLTLGGVSAGPASEEEIALSKSRAIRLLFGLRAINGGVSEYNPVERAILSHDDVFGETVSFTDGFYFEPLAALYRFYDGPVDNESNFVGFGMAEFGGWIQGNALGSVWRAWGNLYDSSGPSPSAPSPTTLFGFPMLTWDGDTTGSGSVSITSFEFFSFS